MKIYFGSTVAGNRSVIEAARKIVQLLDERDRDAATGRNWPEQENVNLTGQISAHSMTVAQVSSLEDLEAFKARMDAQIEKDRSCRRGTPKVLTGPREGAKQESAGAEEFDEASEPP